MDYKLLLFTNNFLLLLFSLQRTEPKGTQFFDYLACSAPKDSTQDHLFLFAKTRMYPDNAISLISSRGAPQWSCLLFRQGSPHAGEAASNWHWKVVSYEAGRKGQCWVSGAVTSHTWTCTPCSLLLFPLIFHQENIRNAMAVTGSSDPQNGWGKRRVGASCSGKPSPGVGFPTKGRPNVLNLLLITKVSAAPASSHQGHVDRSL
jgi:hypothetical protein